MNSVTAVEPAAKKGASLGARLVSAAVALVGLFSLLHFAGAWGMKALCFLASLLGTRELLRMLFRAEDSRTIKSIFFILMIALFLLTAYSTEVSGIAFAIIAILFFSASIWLRQRFNDLMTLTTFLAKCTLGFFYLGLLPGFAAKILDVNNGEVWFIAMLAFVLLGDSFAYFFGIGMGKTLLLPEISPKKTVEGALGGLLGSAVAGVILVQLYPRLPMGPVLALACISGLVGQMGDLFESLLKRVANKKDSGTLMPGHGGILDRLDGVLFASPIVLVGATLIEKAVS